MKKLIVVTCWLSIFGAGWCFGQAQFHGNDGNSWHVLPPAAHTFYVTGFSNGYQEALRQAGVLSIEKAAPEKVSSFPPAERKDYQEILRWAKRIAPFELNGPPKSVGSFRLRSTLSTAITEMHPSAWTRLRCFLSHRLQVMQQPTKS